MPTTIFDSSLITQRNKNKAIADSFISRIQNPSPVNGSAPLLGITEQSLINSIVNGQSTYYRKTNSGCTSVNLGCPCAVQSNTVISGSGGGGGIVPGLVTNITYQYGSLIISWDAPTTGDLPFTYLVELQATNPVYNVSATTSNTTYTFINSQLQPGVGYKIAVTPSNTAGVGPTSYYEEGGEPVEVIGIYQAPTITRTSFSINTCTLGFSFPTSGSGFTITSVICDPVLPSGWSIQSFSNTQIVLINSGSNPASIPGTSFIFSGALGQTTNSSNLVTIQTAGLNPNYWATIFGANAFAAVNGLASDTNGNFYLTGRFSDATFEVKNYSTISDGSVITTTYGTLVNSGGGFDVYLIKYNSLGQVQWATTITGTGTEFGTAITTFSNTDVIVTGYFNSSNISVNNYVSVDPVTKVINVTSFGTIDKTGTSNDAFLVKYNALNGSVVGAVRIGSTGAGSEESVSLCTDSSGDIYVTGSTSSTSLAGITISEYIGAPPPGGAIILPTWGYLSKTASGFAIFIIKYNSTGTPQWATLINKTGTASTRAYDMIYDNNSDCIYVIGQSPSSVIINNFISRNPDTSITLSTFGTLGLTTATNYIVKYRASGVTQGQAQLVTSITNNGTFSNLTGDSAGNLYVSGYSNITSGFQINNWVSGVTVTPYATLPLSISTNTDGFIVKYNSIGQAQWGTTISASDNNGILDITSDGTYIYVVGFFISPTININNYGSETGGVITVSPYGSLARGTAAFNYYIAKYNNAGQALWTTRLDGRTTSAGASARITLDSSSNICVTGFFDTNPLTISQFDNETGGTINVLPYGNLPTIGSTSNIFVIKLNTNGQFI